MGDAAGRLRLDDKMVVVAGAGGGGIGTAICRFLSEAGASVLGLDRNAEALATFDTALYGSPHAAVVADVRDPAAVDAAIDGARLPGQLYGLVHVAGGLYAHQWGSVLDGDLEAFDEVIALNLRSMLVTTRAVGRRLLAQGSGGSIVAIASLAGLSAMPYGASYAAAKAAVMSLVRTTALELGTAGIRVNAVAPGTVATPKNATVSSGTGLSDVERAALPLGRQGHPDDIAGAVLFLLSDLAAWVTGQVLTVDGGSSTRPSFLDPEGLPVFVQNAELRARALGKPR
jgi:3-oxoacyl-[acyl-carrier protein] reductase